MFDQELQNVLGPANVSPGVQEGIGLWRLGGARRVQPGLEGVGVAVWIRCKYNLVQVVLVEQVDRVP